MSYANISQGRKAVVTAGTPVALGTGGAEKVFIQALDGNTGDVVVGGAGVIAAVGTRTGLLVPGGTPLELHADLGSLFIDAENNGDGVAYVAFN